MGATRAPQVADDEDAHQGQEQDLAVDPPGQAGQERGTDGDTCGVATDEQPGRGQRDTEVAADLGQQPGHDELGHADAEGADHQREKGGREPATRRPTVVHNYLQRPVCRVCN